MGPGGHVLTFPVNHGQTLNIVAFKTDPNDWPDPQRLTKPAVREDLLRDFDEYNEKTKKLLGLTTAKLDIVSTMNNISSPLNFRSNVRLADSGPFST